jgi:hypothetical protein
VLAPEEGDKERDRCLGGEGHHRLLGRDGDKLAEVGEARDDRGLVLVAQRGEDRAEAAAGAERARAAGEAALEAGAEAAE